MSELTPWFDGEVKPVRVGLYERKYRHKVDLLDYWDGAGWLYGHHGWACLIQNRAWRGLASDPAKEPS